MMFNGKIFVAGLVLAPVLAFIYWVPPAPVDEFVRLDTAECRAAHDANPFKVPLDCFPAKSGVRMAIEGRLKWLGVI